MKLSFIGMSGVGKSYWAKQLAQAGWYDLDCDSMIAMRMAEIICVGPGEEPVHALGQWMGMPWIDSFADREEQYLKLERQVTSTAIQVANDRTEDTSEKVVIDTTGSVIYTGDERLDQLKQSTRVVYFDVPYDVRQSMVELYLREPKPVLWQGIYQPIPGESQDDALARCYAELLADRAECYRALADVVIDYHAVRQPGFGVSDLLRMIDPEV
ncbi:MAG: hypothetical protein AAGI37_17805 [Planctomycetota bacterium]